eukprot:2556830-Rhodomonas_salina.1
MADYVRQSASRQLRMAGSKTLARTLRHTSWAAESALGDRASLQSDVEDPPRARSGCGDRFLAPSHAM